MGCLIAVDKGQVSLDSEEIVSRYLPELSGLNILEGYSNDGTEILVPAAKKITLRMLLSHSAGE